MYTHLAAAGSDTASLDWHIFLWGLLGGAAAAGAAGAWFAWTRTNRGGRVEMALPAAGQWKLSDSWASNLTAIITALAAVAAIFSSDLTDVFDHRAPLVYSLTTAMMLVFAALAPVGYAVLQPYKPRKNQKDGDGEEFTGTWRAWCLAAGITLFAADGSLASAIGVVQDLHNAPSWAVVLADVVIGVIAVFLLLYAIHTYELMRNVSRNGGSVKKLTGIVAISCCGSDANLTRTRMTML